MNPQIRIHTKISWICNTAAKGNKDTSTQCFLCLTLLPGVVVPVREELSIAPLLLPPQACQLSRRTFVEHRGFVHPVEINPFSFLTVCNSLHLSPGIVAFVCVNSFAGFTTAGQWTGRTRIQEAINRYPTFAHSSSLITS